MVTLILFIDTPNVVFLSCTSDVPCEISHNFSFLFFVRKSSCKIWFNTNCLTELWNKYNDTLISIDFYEFYRLHRFPSKLFIIQTNHLFDKTCCYHCRNNDLYGTFLNFDINK